MIIREDTITINKGRLVALILIVAACDNDKAKLDILTEFCMREKIDGEFIEMISEKLKESKGVNDDR